MATEAGDKFFGEKFWRSPVEGCFGGLILCPDASGVLEFRPEYIRKDDAA